MLPVGLPVKMLGICTKTKLEVESRLLEGHNNVTLMFFS